MKNKSEAFVLQQFGAVEKAFSLQEIDIETAVGKEVLIEVESFGLNYADIMAKNGLYKECPPLPTVIGYEVVGTITQIGSEVSAELLGKKVVAFTQFGGYSKLVKSFDYAVHPIGDLSNHMALALCTQGVTAYYMSHILTQVREGELVLIHAAAGGVGNLLIQICKSKGATVIAKVGNEEKREQALRLGADLAINYNQVDYLEEIDRHYAGRKLDVIYNPVAGKTLKRDLKALAVNGRLLFYGGSELASKKKGLLSQVRFVYDMGILIPIALMMQSKSILGVNMYKIALSKPHIITECLQEIIKLYQSEKINPLISQSFDYTDFNKAVDYLESGQSMGKIEIFWKK